MRQVIRQILAKKHRSRNSSLFGKVGWLQVECRSSEPMVVLCAHEYVPTCSLTVADLQEHRLVHSKKVEQWADWLERQSYTPTQPLRCVLICRLIRQRTGADWCLNRRGLSRKALKAGAWSARSKRAALSQRSPGNPPIIRGAYQ